MEYCDDPIHDGMVGTLNTLCSSGDGVCACVTLMSKGQKCLVDYENCWQGLAVCMGVLVMDPYRRAHLKSGVCMGLAVPACFHGLSALFCSADDRWRSWRPTWLFYKNHYDATDDEAAKLGTFATAPAIRNYPMVLVSKLVATIISVYHHLFHQYRW